MSRDDLVSTLNQLVDAIAEVNISIHRQRELIASQEQEANRLERVRTSLDSVYSQMRHEFLNGGRP